MAGNDITITLGCGGALRALFFVLLSAAALPACSDEASSSPWTKFVQVAGQPDAVPEQWVSTPEGKFAHSIVIPNPVPKDSGYHFWMSSKQYFEHLCATEAGEFIFKKVEGVKGFYFMRPPGRPTDGDLKDRYKLEAPEIERTFQLRRATPESRAAIFVDPPWSKYEFVEEPISMEANKTGYVRSFGRVQGKSEMHSAITNRRESHFGLVWRGIRRSNDRKLEIAGSEWIILDLESSEILAVQRNFARTGFTSNTRDGIWWLNASHCPQAHSRSNLSRRFYEFVSKSLQPRVDQKQ